MKNTKKYMIMTCAIISIALFVIFSIFTIISCENGKSILKITEIDKSIPKITQNKNGFEQNCVSNDEHCISAPTPLLKQGQGKVLIEQSSKRVLYQEGANVRCYPASTTKILTAYIALKMLDLDEIVTITSSSAGIEGSSLYLKAGDTVSVEDLLYGLMLRSGNDCAMALAIKIAGSVEKFADIMNLTAYGLGAFNSHFVNPHGLHDDLHYTTAYDLALITARAYDNEKFVEIVSTQKRKIVVNDEPRYIANKNKLLGMILGANGVKTGYTKKSGRCLVGGAKQDGMQLISVVLNCSDMWNDTVRMLEFGFSNYEMLPLDKAMLSKGENIVKVHIRPNVLPCWKDICYPVKKDGSERIEIVSDYAPFSFLRNFAFVNRKILWCVVCQSLAYSKFFLYTNF